MKLLVILVVLGLLAIGLRLVIPHLGKSVAGGVVDNDGEPSLADCPDTPNCHRAEFQVTREPSQAISTLAKMITQQPGTQIILQDARYLHATFATPVMGFVDDVEFLLDAGNSGTSSGRQPRVLVRSASRLGKSDLGANAKRVEALRNASAL